jgi:hypothetical protein
VDKFSHVIHSVVLRVPGRGVFKTQLWSLESQSEIN